LTTVHTAPARYTQTEFEQAVLSLSPSIAVFDCDGTLWSGDAGYGFMIWSIETGLVSRNASDWIDSRYRQYLAKEISEAEMCGEMVQIYAGLQESEIRHAAAEYFRLHIESHIFPEMHALVARLHQDGVQIWAVSSTNNWVIEEGVRRFNIPASRVLSARVRVDDEGHITSDLIAVPTDEAKATALEPNTSARRNSRASQLDRLLPRVRPHRQQTLACKLSLRCKVILHCIENTLTLSS
jgi:phosphoserine phosphatase